MPTYEVTTNNGKKYEVEADNEHLAAEAVSRLNVPTPEQEDYQRVGNQDSPARQAFDNLDIVDQAAVGLVKPFREAWLGGKSLFTDLTPEEQNEIEVAERGVHGAPAMAGELVGDLGMFALPGGLAMKGATKFGPKAAETIAKAVGKKNATRLTSAALADAAVVTGIEGLKAPTENSSRAERAAWAAGGGVAGKYVGDAASRMIKGVKPSKAAIEVTDYVGDLPLTPGQKGEGFISLTEKGMANNAFTSGKVSTLQDAAHETWNKRVISKAAEDMNLNLDGLDVDDMWKVVDKGVEQRYDDVWKSGWADPLVLPEILGDLDKAQRKIGGFVLSSKELPKKQSEVVRRTIGGAQKVLKSIHSNASQGGFLDLEQLRTVDKDITDALYLATRKGRRELADKLRETKALIRSQLSDDRKVSLDAADKAYTIIKPLKEAQKKSTGILQPSKLATELRKGPTDKIIEGENALYEQAKAAREVFERVSSSGDPNFSLTSILGTIPRAFLTNEPVRKILSGTRPDSEKAKALAKLMADERFIQRIGASMGANN